MRPPAPYLFRNYDLPEGASRGYDGTSDVPAWQALRASTAAPLFFREVSAGSFMQPHVPRMYSFNATLA